MSNAEAIPLIVATWEGDTATILPLLETNIDVRDERGRTPLMHACICGHDNSVALLIAAGANVDARDDYGRCALHCVILKQPQHPLSWTAPRGFEPTLYLLLAAGANINVPHDAGPSFTLPTVVDYALHVKNFKFAAIIEPQRDWSFAYVDNYERYIHLLKARHQLAVARWQLMRRRIATVCFGLHALQLPALMTVAIVDAAWDIMVPLHCKWRAVCMARHFFEPLQ